MTLSEMRSKFVEVTGRYDLSDAQVNFYLNAGMRKLNRAVEGEQFIIEETKSLTNYYLDLTNVLSVLEIYLSSDTGRSKLRKLAFKSFVEFFYGFETATGEPVAWTYGTRTASGAGKRVLFTSTPVETTNVIVRYKEDSVFDTSDDGSETWWSTNYPEALIFASAFMLESFYRNSEGMRDWLLALQNVLDDVEFEFMSLSFHEGMQMSEFGI